MHLAADLRAKVREQLPIPEADREVICRMIARDPAERPAKASEVVQIVGGLACEAGALQEDSEVTRYNPLMPAPPVGPQTTQPTPTPTTPARKKARQKMQSLLEKLARSSDGNGES